MKHKIKALLSLTKRSQVDIAPIFGMTKASFNNKIAAAETRFNLRDAVMLAEATDTQLAFIDKSTNRPIVILDVEDINK